MPQRIGELLVAQGLVTDQDLRDVMVYARQRSMRLCSALVAKGRLLPDDASRALADQHGVHAALVKHLDGRDLALATSLQARLARELVALPLALSRDGAMVVCVRDPGPGTIIKLEQATGRRIILAVAVECLLSPLVQDVYALAPGRGLVGDALAAEPDGFDVDLDDDVGEGHPLDLGGGALVDPLGGDGLQLVDLDDHGVSKAPAEAQSGERARGGPAFFPVGTEPGTLPPPPPPGDPRARRPSAPLLAMPLPDVPRRPSRATAQLAAVSRAAPAAAEPAIEPEPPARTLGLDPALVSLAAADHRDMVVDTLVAYLRHRFAAGVLFVVKDGMALGVDGFAPGVAPETVQALVVPLNQPSVLRAAHDQGASFVGAPTLGSVIQDRMFKILGGAPDRCVVVPITIRDRIVNLVYAHDARRSTLEEAAVELGTVADAAEEAFVRIILESKT